MRNRWGVIVLVAVVSFFTGGWLLQRGVASDGNVYQQARLFDDVLSHVDRYFVDSIGQPELYRKATNGLLEQLHDPYSVLLDGDDYRQLTETTTGNYAGLGIQIDVRDGWITVVAPLPDTPAERAGVQTGDQIIAVDGKSTEGWKNEQAIKALRGDAGTKVELQIRRIRQGGAAEPFTLSINRAIIHVRSVQPGTVFPGGIGYISLSPVSETSSAELRAEIGSLEAKGMKSLVLDLRGNPGGLLDQGVKVSDLFLNAGQEVVSTRGRAKGSTRSFQADGKQAWPNLPIVTLVNEGTASAAEIISGALQDHDRAVVVGVPTFGKGLVQTLFPLSETSALKLTTARWYTPSGRTIQRIAKSEDDQEQQVLSEAAGVAPKPPVKDTSTQVYRSDAGRLLKGGGGIVPDIIVRQDTLSAGERAFATALGSHFTEYRDALTSYALELKSERAITSESFAITPQMRQKLYERLKAKKVAVDQAMFDKAQPLVDEQLSYEIARYVFGRPAEFKRRAEDDRQLQSALALLRKAQSPKDLMNLAISQGSAPSKN